MTHFPPDLQSSIARAMQMYAESSGTSADLTKLTAARDQACRYAHESGWLPETMVIALRHALESLGAFGQVPHSGSRAAYDRLVAGSLRVYFETRLPGPEPPRYGA